MLPRWVNIGPLRFRLTDKQSDWDKRDESTDDHWGLTDKAAGLILLDPGMNADLQRLIVLHELLHACCFASGMHDTRKRDEETWVAMVTPMLLDAIGRSPGMAAFLFGSNRG